MSPAAGGAAPAQSAGVAAAAAATPAIAAPPEPGRAAPRRDPPGQQEGADPANAAARKTVWNVPAPPPAAAAAAAGATPGGGGGIIGGDASWPALAESARAWPKSASSDSLKSLSDGSGPLQQEDSSASSVPPPHPVVEVNPIPTSSNPTSTEPPNSTAMASSQRNSSTNQPNPVRRGGSNGGNNGGGSRGNGSNGSRRAANSSGGDGRSGSGGDGNWNEGSIGTGSGCNSSNTNGSSNLSDNVPGGGAGGSGNESSRNAPGSSHWNNNIRADVQPYPVYLPPIEQFQNMHLVRPPMQPAWAPPPQDQPNLQDDIRNQIEFYFSTNNLCHDTFLRRHMNDQGWVPIDLILGFNRMRAFTGFVDTNYILDAIRDSELLEVQSAAAREVRLQVGSSDHVAAEAWRWRGGGSIRNVHGNGVKGDLSMLLKSADDKHFEKVTSEKVCSARELDCITAFRDFRDCETDW
ncbi:uncharacterized protein C2845_PM03G04820 [Panicum miliaceum]|uniref:HTH La-type RNA-binding domain-containing protein n=1 Tax=Panicum miliaceum TaxID=4540 RepID=A0A3L6T5Z2_PANMI|nr:uncharacterized protein C2845_PM03G04820 [Panicum miliaceum]